MSNHFQSFHITTSKCIALCVSPGGAATHHGTPVALAALLAIPSEVSLSGTGHVAHGPDALPLAEPGAVQNTQPMHPPLPYCKKHKSGHALLYFDV